MAKVGIYCPHCRSFDVYSAGTLRGEKRYRCQNPYCGRNFRLAFDESNIPDVSDPLEDQYTYLLDHDWWPVEIFRTYDRLQPLVVENTLWVEGLPLDFIYPVDTETQFVVEYRPENYAPITLASISYHSGVVTITKSNAIALLNFEYGADFDCHSKKNPTIQATIAKIKGLVWHLYENSSPADRLSVVVHRYAANFERFKQSILDPDSAETLDTEHYYSIYTTEYLDQNRGRQGYTISTWLSDRLKGKARFFAKNYERAMEKDIAILAKAGRVEKGRSIKGGTAWFWSDR